MIANGRVQVASPKVRVCDLAELSTINMSRPELVTAWLQLRAQNDDGA